MASILLSLIPFVLLFIFNLFIYCLVKRSPLPRSSSRQRREQGVARILILIILVYIACHGIITYINIIEIWGIMRGTLSTTVQPTKSNMAGNICPHTIYLVYNYNAKNVQVQANQMCGVTT